MGKFLALLGVVVGTVLTASVWMAAADGGPGPSASCSGGTVTDDGTSQTFSLSCSVPDPPAVTVTATATETVTVTATPSPTASASPTATPTALPSTPPPSATTSAVPTPTATATVSPSAGTCASSAANVPDGSDGAGGCFPGVANTGPNAAASSMSTYAGSCTISSANVVIDSKVVNCRTLVIASGGAGFKLTNSYLNGGIVQSGGSPAFTVQDSFVDSSISYPACGDGSCPAGKYACGDTGNQTSDCGVTGSNFTILRTEIVGSNRAAYCEAPGPCLIQDSYFHGTNLWPDKSNLAHASSVREEQNLTLRHNSLFCSYTGPFVNGDIGCSANLTGYPDFIAIKNNTVDSNLFVAAPGAAFCMYGGGTAGKPHSSDSDNATGQKFTNNVFQRGGNRKCADYGPVTDFLTGRTGNVWSGNHWDDGTAVPAG